MPRARWWRQPWTLTAAHGGGDRAYLPETFRFQLEQEAEKNVEGPNSKCRGYVNFKGRSERVSNFRNGWKREMCIVRYSWRRPRNRSWLEIRASCSKSSKQSSVTYGFCPNGWQVKRADEAFCLASCTWNPQTHGFWAFPSSWSRGHGDVFWLMLVETANGLSPLELLKPHATNSVTYNFFFCSQFRGHVPVKSHSWWQSTLRAVSSRDGREFQEGLFYESVNPIREGSTFRT